jgi:biotin operon repressor
MRSNISQLNNWGQSNINLVNQKGKRLMGAINKWGQSNINFQSKVIKAKGG